MRLISLQIGLPQERVSALADGQESLWYSAIFKTPVAGRVRLEKTNLGGDCQGDRKNHGGPDKAVCCYAAEHYPGWRAALGLDAAAFPCGAFGENFTLEGMTEETVCIGDIYTIGAAIVQISQPRMPCYKMGRRWGLPQIPLEARDSGRTGYYLRVMQPGDVGAGDALVLIERPLPRWTIARLNHAMYVHTDDTELADELARLPLLAEAWRTLFRRRAARVSLQ